ncbi:C45 family peptidase [Sediminicola luteus]|uniref:C45 family peptidase n=1 Tax=Sediminicola luteus TaxID=319238 RepID=A0ABV2TWX9_9FLAO
MQLQFNAISELGEPGAKFKNLFDSYWPAYHSWLTSKGAASVPDLATSQAALRKYMPEMVPTYERLCYLVNADVVAARFLTGFQPPAYISACSQAVLVENEVHLVRNYDYHPDLFEGTLLLSSWNGKKVMATSDCLIGAVDGMNESGLAISLTFGGRKVVGEGFGIPFILRYVLEFCDTVEEAVAALIRIPSHMAYNVTVVDRRGIFKTVLLSPDRTPLVTDAAFATNHQIQVDWPENATFNKTLERSAFLNDLLAQKGLDAKTLADAFLRRPLYNTLFSEGFGTLYTSSYQPVAGTMQLRWPNEVMYQSFDNFTEAHKLIQFGEPAKVLKNSDTLMNASPETSGVWPQESLTYGTLHADWQETVAASLVNTMDHAAPFREREKLQTLSDRLVHRGEISWEILADYWAKVGSRYWDHWKN